MLDKSDIAWLKSELIPEVAKQVAEKISVQLDRMETTLDKFAGNVQSLETEQTLQSGRISLSPSP